MALTISSFGQLVMCYSDKGLRSAIAFEVAGGYRNALGRQMRFNNFLQSKIFKLYTRSKHKFTENLLEEVDSYGRASISDRSKLLNKVSVLMGYNNLHDLIENEKVQKEIVDYDVLLACKRFPSIVLGRSPSVKLYDESMTISKMRNLLSSQNCKDYLNSATTSNLLDPDSLCETMPSQYPALPNVDSLCVTVDSPPILPISSEILYSETKESLDAPVTVEEPFSSAEQLSGVELLLDKSTNALPGLSKRQYNQLEKGGFYTLRKLLHHFPRTYADLQNAQIGIDEGNYLIFVGKVLLSRGIKASSSFSFVEVVVECEVIDGEAACTENVTEACEGKKNVYLHLKKFFRGTRFTNSGFLRALQEKHREGDIVCVSGKVRAMRSKDHYEMKEYNLDVLDDAEDKSQRVKGRPYPIYPSKGGLNPKFIGDIIRRALQTLTINIDPIPVAILKDFGLVSLHDAYIGIHQPKDFTEADSARRRLIFDEFFYLQLSRLFQMLEGLGTNIEKDVLLDKYRQPELNAAFIEDWSPLTKMFLKALPYSLTSSQLSAVSEIIWDLKRLVPMNRLLQGDVGCGKTVVAFLACMEVVGSGYQAAFMVPTELLAIQHYEHFLNLLESMNDVQCKPSVALLTGSTPSKQTRIIRKGLQTGDISFVIGTHSLISENVEFFSLRIAVVDEQHRFGVVQRGRFNSKLYYTCVNSRMAEADSDGSAKADSVDSEDGSAKADAMAPHILAMSATPIPRTLALALYGDMSLTQITDMPPGRTPVETHVIEGNESGLERVYQMMLDELQSGGKVYLVYPVIVPSEQLPQLLAASEEFETVSKRFESYNCGLLHGKMKSDDKDDALRKFRSGETRILLSTQVIEIGVDVPDASMMVVMNAERFGIAQLHQLRGRVGRGIRKSACIFVSATSSGIGRLKVLQKSSDGFHLANTDLVLRGPGDLLGKKQSGHLPEFPIARLELDGNILQDSHLAALKILGTSHDLELFPQLKAELSMRHPLCPLGD